jgi:iodotyrosine deiodinase
MNHLPHYNQNLSNHDSLIKVKEFEFKLKSRRSIRFFDDKPVDIEVIKTIISIANHSPSGANKQPWHFCVVQDPNVKKQIRIAAEKEEFENYNGRMSDEWLEDLKPLGTDWEKPFLEIAPFLIVVFKKSYDFDTSGNKLKNYYVMESCGIACGFLITAIHMAGLVTLTHTPSPMNFLQSLLHRPENEKPFLLLPVGYPSKDATVPDINKKNLDQVMTIY